MIDEIARVFRQHVPLEITSVSSENGSLTLSGSGWGFGTNSAWRVLKNADVIVDWSENDPLAGIRRLNGDSLVDVDPQSGRMRGDPALRTSGGLWIEIFSDQSLDPWILRLPSGTYIGDPRDSRLNR